MVKIFGSFTKACVVNKTVLILHYMLNPAFKTLFQCKYVFVRNRTSTIKKIKEINCAVKWPLSELYCHM